MCVCVCVCIRGTHDYNNVFPFISSSKTIWRKETVAKFFGDGESRQEKKAFEEQVDVFVTDVPWGVCKGRGRDEQCGIITSDIVTDEDISSICEGVKRYLKKTGKSSLPCECAPVCHCVCASLGVCVCACASVCACVCVYHPGESREGMEAFEGRGDVVIVDPPWGVMKGPSRDGQGGI